MQLNANQEISPLAARPMAETSNTATSTSGSNSASITANDFLELLVTEMRNQDPTANTDPNEYINQLVQVNSLQQLIQINQDLGGSSSDASSPSAGAAGAVTHAATRQVMQPHAAGNLTLPASGAAASRLARALAPPAHSPGASPLSAYLPASNPNPAR